MLSELEQAKFENWKLVQQMKHVKSVLDVAIEFIPRSARKNFVKRIEQLQKEALNDATTVDQAKQSAELAEAKVTIE